MSSRQGRTDGGRGTNQYGGKGGSQARTGSSTTPAREAEVDPARPGGLDGALPEGAVHAWRELGPVVPPVAYLAGGTALAAHLHHRLSRDLDFFTDGPFDEAELADILRARGRFAVTDQSAGTLSGVFEDTKVQFLDASTQYPVHDFVEVGGVRIASLPDLLATKVKVIADRGELRDYFDLMVIEQRTDLTVEQGLVLFIERYRPASPESAIAAIVRGLGYLDDVMDDPGLPVGREEVAAYWSRRAPQVVRWFAAQAW